MTEDLTVPRGDADPREELKAHIEAQLEAALAEKESRLELAQGPPGNEWEVYAWGPWQEPFDPSVDPGRIIFTGETAYIGVAVWMNDEMCPDIVNHEDKIQLSFWTSNTQTMLPVPELSYTCCITTEQNGACFYVMVWEFTPAAPACLYETNICARICNCQGHTLPRYAAFVRHVYDYDPSSLWPDVPGWGFDRPIRYMVVDPTEDCDCEGEC